MHTGLCILAELKKYTFLQKMFKFILYILIVFRYPKSSHDSMDYRLVRFICKLHHTGVTRLSEVEAALKRYVNKDLFRNGMYMSKKTSKTKENILM